MRQVLDFLTQWGAVLRDSLPLGVQNARGRGRRFAVLEPTGDGWRLFQARGTALDPQGTGNPARLAEDVGRLDGPTVLLLPEELAMRPVLTLPGTAARSLDQVLDVEIERLTPFKASDIAVAKEVAPSADGQIRVALTIVPLARIEEHVAPLRDAGINVAHVLAQRAHLSRTPEMSVSGAAEVARRDTAGWVPAVVTLALLAAALVSPFAAQEQQLENRQAKLEELGPELAKVQRLTRDVEAAQARERVLHRFLMERTAMTALLEETTRVLPDHTWLTLYRVGDGRMTLEGQSSSATSLISVLNGSPRLSDVRFNAPVTRDPASGAERFRLDAVVDKP
jgi:general secretion pathway protein L